MNQEYELTVNEITLATEEEENTKFVTNQASLMNSMNPETLEQVPNLVDQSQTSIQSTENDQSTNSIRDTALPTIQESANRAVQNVSSQNSSIQSITTSSQ